MLKLFVDFFVSYARTTSIWRMVVHTLLFAALTAWVGIISVGVLKFDTWVEMYDRYDNNGEIDVREAMLVSAQVNTLLTDQRARLDIDRIFVSKFHNGKVDLNGIHFLFFSRISEVNGPGVSNELAQTQNLPLSVFPDMITAIVEDECYYIETVDSTVENSSFLGTMGVRSRMICPIYDITNSLVGIIGVEGVRNQINRDREAELVLNLKTLAGVLGSIITNP